MEKKINIEKVKQVTLIVFGVVLIGVGFFNYNTTKDENEITKIAVTDVGNNRVGDVQLVSSNAIVENDLPESNLIVENDILDDNYFTKTKMERDEMYSKMLDSYQKIVDNRDLSETQKSISIQEIDKINKAQNAIMISENLIKNKGFEDAVVLVNDNAINVVVKTSFLGNEDIGKIQNIIEREFEVDLSKVNISSKQ